MNANIKAGLEALKPVSIFVALGGAYLLYNNGLSVTPLSYGTLAGYGLVGVGVASYAGEIVTGAFLS